MTARVAVAIEGLQIINKIKPFSHFLRLLNITVRESFLFCFRFYPHFVHVDKFTNNIQIQWRQFKRTDEQKTINNGRNTEDCGCWYYSSTKYKSDRVLEWCL